MIILGVILLIIGFIAKIAILLVDWDHPRGRRVDSGCAWLVGPCRRRATTLLLSFTPLDAEVPPSDRLGEPRPRPTWTRVPGRFDGRIWGGFVMLLEGRPGFLGSTMCSTLTIQVVTDGAVGRFEL